MYGFQNANESVKFSVYLYGCNFIEILAGMAMY